MRSGAPAASTPPRSHRRIAGSPSVSPETTIEEAPRRTPASIAAAPGAEREVKAMSVRATAEQPLLSRLSASDVAALAERCRRSSHATGAAIFSAGDRGDAVHILISGRVRLLARNARGNEAVVRIVHAGDSFGELAVLTGSAQSLTAVACEPSRTAMVPRAAFFAWLAERPGASVVLLELLSLRLDRIAVAMADLLVLDLPQRLAKQLAALAWTHRRARQPNGEVRIPLTQAELGSRLGISRESVNKGLRVFAAEGWLSTERGVLVVKNEDALRAFGESGDGWITASSQLSPGT